MMNRPPKFVPGDDTAVPNLFAQFKDVEDIPLLVMLIKENADIIRISIAGLVGALVETGIDIDNELEFLEFAVEKYFNQGAPLYPFVKGNFGKIMVPIIRQDPGKEYLFKNFVHLIYLIDAAEHSDEIHEELFVQILELCQYSVEVFFPLFFGLELRKQFLLVKERRNK